MEESRSVPGVYPPPLQARSSISSTSSNHSTTGSGLRKANSKFKPATGPPIPAVDASHAALRKTTTSAPAFTSFATPGFGKKPVPHVDAPLSAPPPRREIIDLSSEPSLSDISGWVPSKRLSGESEFVQGSSVKRLKLATSSTADHTFRASSSKVKSKARHVSPEQGADSSDDVSKESSRTSFQSKLSPFPHVDGLSSISSLGGPCATPTIQRTENTSLLQSPQRQSPKDFLDLDRKSLESLRSLLSRSREYRQLIADIMTKHVLGVEEHDLIVLSLILDLIGDRMRAIEKQIALVQADEQWPQPCLTKQKEKARIPTPVSTPPSETPIICRDIGTREPSPAPALPCTADSMDATSTAVATIPTATTATIISLESPRIEEEEITLDAQDSADLTTPDSDDKLWDAVDTGTPEMLMDPRGISRKPILPDASSSASLPVVRIDHTASPYYAEVISLLKGTFKLSHFRKNQLECITATLDGRDVFYLAPTGGGKSLCFQLPALCRTGKTQGTTFVISPLLSLIEDQVLTLRKKGIRAFRLINTADADEAHDAMPRLRKGESMPLVYTTPEKLLGNLQDIATNGRSNLQEIVTQLYEQKQLARFVVDEAHVILGWRSFRESVRRYVIHLRGLSGACKPQYSCLGLLRQRWPDVPILALTGSANKATIEDIKESLALKDPICLTQSFNRSNLYYEVRKKPSQKKELLQEIAGFVQSRHKDDTGIIYCLSRDDCEDTAKRLREEFNLSARHFHAGMDREEKRVNQEDWSNGKCKIIVATIAFGMGIDKSNVRFVIHATMSKDMDGYYQETGRAGRDGEPSDCVLFYAYSDAMKIQHMLKNSHEPTKAPPDEIQRQLERLSAVVAYCANESDCRRVTILRHFDETFDEEECHKSCDNCCKPGVVISEDYTDMAQQAVRLLRDMKKCTRDRGITMTLFKDVLRGKKGKTVTAFQGLPHYGAAASLDHRMMERMITQLLHSDIFSTRRMTSGNGYGNNYLEVSYVYKHTGSSSQSI
ncbi:hypothetical protein ID866_1504 [Astraeus odoratus]|nr:hypothetical protein ID866_1504 [Astraeus odoratus]